MTKEQEAIEDFRRQFEQCNYNKSDLIIELDYAKIIIDMIDNNFTEIKQKDKMIDLMIDYIDKISEYYTKIEGKNNDFCDEKCIDKNIDCYDCIKKYFERKSEE